MSSFSKRKMYCNMHTSKIILIAIAVAIIAATVYILNMDEGFDSSVQTCTPSDGVWSRPDPSTGRQVLASPCCQPPDFGLPDSYKTCENSGDEQNPEIRACLEHCCKFRDTNYKYYDPSWYGMATCGCSLYCYNSGVPHFRKYGDPVHYLSGDIAEQNTPDTGGFIDPTKNS
jgi:hypothetical protein